MYTANHADKARGVMLPSKDSVELAELMGIVAGDGCVTCYSYSNKYTLYVAGDALLDKEYLLSYVSSMLEHMFGVEPSSYFRKDQRTMTLYLNSKTIALFLAKKGIPKGLKGDIKIPIWIKRNAEFVKAFLRGYFDTDGSFHLRRGKYPIISTANKSKPLIADITEVLLAMGFNFTRYYKESRFDRRTKKTYTSYKICLYGDNNLSLWEQEIGFKNNRHRHKITAYIKREMGTLGFEPRTP